MWHKALSEVLPKGKRGDLEVQEHGLVALQLTRSTRPKAHQVGREGLALAVPEGVDKDLVVLDGDGADGGAQVERAALEHDAVLIVDAGALGEDE